MFRPVNTHKYSFDFLEDRISGRDPDERGGGFVVVLDESFDGTDEVGDAVERAALNGALVDEDEPACQ